MAAGVFTLLTLLFLAIFANFACYVYGKNRSFTIDYDNNTFLKDGKPFRYISGSIDYQRVPWQYWEDRIKKMYAGGFNAVQTYVPWNLHEPQPEMYDFFGQQNLPYFLQLAQKYDLLVILRPGPFICDEWDFGGLPAWLLKNNPDIFIRTMDPKYLKPVDRWFTVLYQVIKPFLYVNGGPIITVQIENEYGYFPIGCDMDYMRFLTKKAKDELSNDLVLFTVDGAGLDLLKCGNLKGELLATLDFGLTFNPQKEFDILRQWQPKGPLVNSEFYTGRFDSWGKPHVVQDAAQTAKSIDLILELGANIDLDMFEGGTSFGFMNGANYPNLPELTSYDYDSPLSEAGDVREKYMLIREVFKKYRQVPDVDIPPNLPKYAYGKVNLKFTGTVHDYILEHTPVASRYPVNFEDLEHYYGFVLYRHVLKDNVKNQGIDLSGVRDRAYVCIDQKPVAVVEWATNSTTIHITGVKGQTLDILVENQGRLSFSIHLVNSTKGIITNVTTVEGEILEDWLMYPVVLTDKYPSAMTHIPKLYKSSGSQRNAGLMTPSFYLGHFNIPFEEGHPMDTYLDTQGWSKGQAFINGFNLGRYWPVRGPQIRLYVPKFVLQQGINTVEFMELQGAPCSGSAPCSIEFMDKPYLNGTIHPDITGKMEDGKLRFKSRRDFLTKL